MNCTPNLGHSHQRDRFRHFWCTFHKFSPIFNLWQTQQSWDWFNASNLKIETLLIKHNFKLTWILFITYSPRKNPNNTPFLSLHEHKINEFINLKVQSIFAKLQLSVKSISYSTQISLHVYKKFYITTGTNIYPGFPMIYPKLLIIVFTCTLIFTWFSLRWSCMLINQHILVNFQLPLKHELVWLFW